MTNKTEQFPKTIFVCDNTDENVPCDFVADSAAMFHGNNVEYIRADLAVPEGRAIVPLEPTDRMSQAAHDAWLETMLKRQSEGKLLVPPDDIMEPFRRTYRAMIAAAQKGGE